MEPESLFPCSQGPIIDPCPELDVLYFPKIFLFTPRSSKWSLSYVSSFDYSLFKDALSTADLM